MTAMTIAIARWKLRATHAIASLALTACSQADDSIAPRASPPASLASAPPSARARAALAPAPTADSAIGAAVGLAPGSTSPAAPAPRPLSPAAQVGKQLFFDRALSASGTMSCASCHDPEHAYGPANDHAVQRGGRHGISPGVRAVPSLRYKEFTPGYADLIDNADGLGPPGPGGGFGWDGRSDSLAEQSRIPLLAEFEMANASPADAVERLRASGSAAGFIRAFGSEALADRDTAFAKLQLALQSFQLEDPSFHPYSSKYDLYLYRKPGGELTPAEQRGLGVFSDPKTGNCSGCHLASASLDDGAPPQLTNFSFEAIGVPRNAQLPRNRDRKFSDLGVCGPLRDDHATFTEFCGLFKTPTLRNVATRRALFHNGVIHSLEQAVRFHNTRDTRPELWYPTLGGRARPRPDREFPRYGLVTTQYVGGIVQKFDDLPVAYRGNIDKQLPLDGRAAGSEPPMTEQDLADLICFLRTLTDADQSNVGPSPRGCSR